MKKLLITADNDWFRQRITAIVFCIIAAFAVILIRLFYLQVFKGTEYRRLSQNNCIRLQSIDSTRGLIFDRNGKLIADNRPSFDLSIICKDAEHVEATIEKLAEYIKVPPELLMDRVERHKQKSLYKPVLLKKDIGRTALAAVEVNKFDLPGVIVNVKQKRHYINTESAAHVIGYIGKINLNELKSGKFHEARSGDFVGKFGIEKTYERFLRGRRGGRQVEVNAAGQVVKILKTVEAQPGNNLFLSIDCKLQNKAGKLIEGKTGAIVAMDPGSGEILALASSPSFNQNIFINGMTHKAWSSLVSNPFSPLENKVVQGEYPPASIYKIVTAIAGLEEGIIDDKTALFCPGYYTYGSVFRCWKKSGHGSLNVVQALAQSCDVFFYQVGQKLGVDRLAWYAGSCGLSSPTGIKLEGEASGLIPTSSWKKKKTGLSWQGGETLSAAIGQSYNLVTPLQMVVLIGAIANGGIIYKPIIVKSIKNPQGNFVDKAEQQIMGKIPAGKETMEIIKKGLWDVVNDRSGTAWNARIEGLDVSGKTGTAQIVGRDKNADGENESELAYNLKPHAWFVGYAPSVSPKIAVAVIVEHGGHGSGTAAPIALKLIEFFTNLSN